MISEIIFKSILDWWSDFCLRDITAIICLSLLLFTRVNKDMWTQRYYVNKSCSYIESIKETARKLNREQSTWKTRSSHSAHAWYAMNVLNRDRILYSPLSVSQVREFCCLSCWFVTNQFSDSFSYRVSQPIYMIIVKIMGIEISYEPIINFTENCEVWNHLRERGTRLCGTLGPHCLLVRA